MPKINFTTVLKIATPFIKTLAILIIGHFLSVYLAKLVKKALERSKLDISLIKFLCKAINISLHIIIVLSALGELGISTTGLLAALSAAAVGVALALKDSLSNIAGGILLLISPRFVTGDFIEENGEMGTVVSVDLMHTTIRTIDNRRVIIPNGVLLNSQIVNYSREEKRRVDLTFPISYENDVKLAEKTAIEAIKKHPLIINEPEEPFARVMSYGDSSVNIITRSWCEAKNYWTVYFDLNEQIKSAFDTAGITIPYNQLDVHINNKE